MMTSDIDSDSEIRDAEIAAKAINERRLAAQSMPTVKGLLLQPCILVTCPHQKCETEFDLFEFEQETDPQQKDIWHLLECFIGNKDHTVVVDCPECKKQFNVDGLDY